jgi:phage terminase large subunit-like protein
MTGYLSQSGFTGTMSFPSDDPSIVHRERGGWTKTFEETRPTHPHQLATGVDLAISESDSADYTAFVTGSVWGKHEHKMIYIVDAFKSKMDFPTTVETLEFYHKKNSDIHNIK